MPSHKPLKAWKANYRYYPAPLFSEAVCLLGTQTTFIAGAGLIPKPATGPAAQGTLAENRIVSTIAHRIEEWWPLGREVGWLRELGGGGT